jgi:hypothetical protein
MRPERQRLPMQLAKQRMQRMQPGKQLAKRRQQRMQPGKQRRQRMLLPVRKRQRPERRQPKRPVQMLPALRVPMLPVQKPQELLQVPKQQEPLLLSCRRRPGQQPTGKQSTMFFS